MFGGNLGNEAAPKPQASMRLDDFWKLKVHFVLYRLCRVIRVGFTAACTSVNRAAAEEVSSGPQKTTVILPLPSRSVYMCPLLCCRFCELATSDPVQALAYLQVSWQ